jgi:rubrerythrin
MSLLKVLDQINTEDFNEEQQAQMVNREKALHKMGDFSKKMALAALPLGALATFASAPAKAKSAQQDIKILNYALTLELLEHEFYDQAVACGIIPGSDRPIFVRIQEDEKAHVAFLQEAIKKAGGTPHTESDFKFDYTANGMFDPFNRNGTGQRAAYKQLKEISQAFEDTGVRAYKGQAPRIKNATYLTAALQIHSVEARHAAEVRGLRFKYGVDTLPWITGAGKKARIGALGKVIYGAGSEYNVSEGNIDQAGINVGKYVTKAASTQAFDEPLGMKYVKTKILPPFVPALRK